MSRVRVTAPMTPTVLHHMVVSASQSYADHRLFIEAERRASGAGAAAARHEQRLFPVACNTHALTGSPHRRNRLCHTPPERTRERSAHELRPDNGRVPHVPPCHMVLDHPCVRHWWRRPRCARYAAQVSERDRTPPRFVLTRSAPMRKLSRRHRARSSPG